MENNDDRWFFDSLNRPVFSRSPSPTGVEQEQTLRRLCYPTEEEEAKHYQILLGVTKHFEEFMKVEMDKWNKLNKGPVMGSSNSQHQNDDAEVEDQVEESIEDDKENCKENEEPETVHDKEKNEVAGKGLKRKRDNRAQEINYNINNTGAIRK